MGLALMFLTAISSQAQIRFGVQGGFDLTKMSLSGSALDLSNRAGFYVGPTLKFSIPVTGLAADVSALYDSQSSKVDGVKINRQYVSIPVNLRAGLGLGQLLSVFVTAGPQVSFNVGDGSFSWGDAKSYKSTFQLKKSLFSVNLGGGVLIKDIQVSARYNIPVGRTGDITLQDVLTTPGTGLSAGSFDVKSKSSWLLGLTYFF